VNDTQGPHDLPADPAGDPLADTSAAPPAAPPADAPARDIPTQPGHDIPARWLTGGVAGIGLASFFSDAGHEIVTSLLPSFVVSTLGAPAAALGLIEGISDGLSGGARLAGGILAEEPSRRRKIAVGGYTVTALLSSFIGAAHSVWQVGALRAGAWTSRGIRVPARNAILADIVPPEAYGRAYGFERALDNLGAICGPLLAIALVGLTSVRTAIRLSIIPGLAAAIAIAYAVRKMSAPKPRQATRLLPAFRQTASGPLGRLLLAISAFEVGNVAATLLILRTTELLQPTKGRQAATQLALALYVGYNTAATLVSFPAGKLGDRFGPRIAFAAGIALFGLSYLGFASGGSVAALGIWFAAAGLGIGCVETAEHSAVAAMAPQGIRASAFGVLAAIQSLGNLAASAVAGILWTAVSARAAFVYLVAWMVVALVGVAALGSVRSTPGPPQDVA
jgi:MFS family permease